MSKITVDATQYDWTELEGVRSLLDFAQAHGPAVDDIYDIKNADKAKHTEYPVFTGRDGSRYPYMENGVIMKDGAVLVCVTVLSFAGTFSEYDDIRVKYYGLIRK